MKSSILVILGAALLAAPGLSVAEEAAPAELAPIQTGASPEQTAEAMPEPGLEPLEAEPEELFEETAEPEQADFAVEPEALGDPPAAAELHDAVDAAAADAVQLPAAPAPEAGSQTVLGEIGYDAEGRPGRIHVVSNGDTLWDISDAYLGTPWVWPSIWNDNDQVENPHLIYPGDRIWITDTEMRRISAEEAEAMLGNRPAAPLDPAPAASEPALTPELAVVPEQRRLQRVSDRESAGLVTAEQLESAASVVGSIPDRIMLTQVDEVYVGLGEGEVQVGDEFTIFRKRERVFDPDTRELLGWHVEFLGWVEIKETHPETSVAVIRKSTDGIEIGDRLMPREALPADIAVQPSPAGVEGKISYFSSRRTMMAMVDYVYLNRGSLDGVEVGSPLEVYRQGYPAAEIVRGDEVRVPDRVVANLLVVRTQPESSVAFVTRSATELRIGDQFRGDSQN
jgi:hypothetical protein